MNFFFYLKYSIKYGDNTDPIVGDVLRHGKSKKYKIRVEFDEEATAERKESLMASKQSEYYNEVMEGWKADYPLTIEEAVWADVKFNNSYELVTAE